jgi:hypothetical protein
VHQSAEYILYEYICDHEELSVYIMISLVHCTQCHVSFL